MSLIVQKFGGTSVGDPDRMRAVADHIARTKRRGNDVVVVISAMGKETDELLRLASDVSSERPGREMDMLVTAGERKAMALLSMALHDVGVDGASFTGSQAGFITDTNHTNAKIVDIRPDRMALLSMALHDVGVDGASFTGSQAGFITDTNHTNAKIVDIRPDREAIKNGQVPVVGGAQGVSTDRDVTFLGRGGSDTTAVALAHALDADVCELYTDVSGVYTSDPRVVDHARKMEHISFDELLEMTASGCPKPAMRSVEFARTWGVDLHVRSAFTWEPGTLVTKEDPAMEQAIISAVTHDADNAKVTILSVPDKPGVAGSVFRSLARADINVDVIVQNTSEQGHTDISFTCPIAEAGQAAAVCELLVGDLEAKGVSTDPDVASVSVVGAGMKTHPGVAATVFETLASNDINIEMISTSAIRISCVVRRDDVEKAVLVLHDAFSLGDGPALVD